MRTREIIVKSLPRGPLSADNFEQHVRDLDAPQPGQLLVRNILLSIDAANRAWMQGATYREAVKAGDVMHSYAIAEIVASASERFAPGDLVATEAGWADYSLVSARGAMAVLATEPLSHLHSLYGIAGRTAYHGLVDIGRPNAGETVLVSAAAGSVGSFVGQIAKALGCRVVGIAGGAEKCAWVVSELGFDACVDYRADGLFKAIRRACPDGVDVYFDNVGGAILETALAAMNQRGRIVCCGAISQYDDRTPPTGPRNLPGAVVMKRLRMEGFIVTDFWNREDSGRALKALGAWSASGQIKVVEDIVEGLENAPQALVGLLAGDNRGKRLVRVGPDSQS